MMSLPRVPEPLGEPVPYIIPAYQGEQLTIPGTKSVFRVLASAKESGGQISVFRMDGVLGDPVVFHHHNKAHDVFMCTRGHLKIWAGDQARLLGPGDFCSVPPKVIHRPQLVDPWNETIGLVTPGKWVDYFRFISEQYSGILTDEFDDRNTGQTLFPKKDIIEAEYDVIFDPTHPACEIGEWTTADTIIPEGTETYFLRADTGPRHLLGGVLSRTFITTAQSAGEFAITSIESSSVHPPSILGRPFTFKKVHQVYYVLDGAIEVTVAGVGNKIHAGETIFVPAGTEISIAFTEKFTRFWAFSSGNGLESFIRMAGRPLEGVILPDMPDSVENEKVVEAAARNSMEISI